MRGVPDEFGWSEIAREIFALLFLVFYLTPALIFVNRLGLPAKNNSLRAANELAGQTPQ